MVARNPKFPIKILIKQNNFKCTKIKNSNQTKPKSNL